MLFPSDMYHWAEDTTREFHGIRVTAAYKLKKVEDNDGEPQTFDSARDWDQIEAANAGL